jgi:hypothetical protein
MLLGFLVKIPTPTADDPGKTSGEKECCLPKLSVVLKIVLYVSR